MGRIGKDGSMAEEETPHDKRGPKGGFPKVGMWARTMPLLRDVRHELWKRGLIVKESDAECLEHLVRAMARELGMSDVVRPRNPTPSATTPEAQEDRHAD